MTIFNTIQQLIASNLITVEEMKGKEHLVIEIVKNAEAEGLREMFRTIENNEQFCVSNAIETTQNSIVRQIKAL